MATQQYTAFCFCEKKNAIRYLVFEGGPKGTAKVQLDSRRARGGGHDSEPSLARGWLEAREP